MLRLQQLPWDVDLDSAEDFRKRRHAKIPMVGPRWVRFDRFESDYPTSHAGQTHNYDPFTKYDVCLHSSTKSIRIEIFDGAKQTRTKDGVIYYALYSLKRYGKAWNNQHEWGGPEKNDDDLRGDDKRKLLSETDAASLRVRYSVFVELTSKVIVGMCALGFLLP